ncbi:MAG TPA: acetyl-CoA carboxylase biotin carboxyl carrier protein subunit [Bacteriovoracaceae bacterium]|nr:acetyl-CoA carboxylase biotin carboxyl carrier protein subunit [Bacteriovoracaceae bacterium]
MDKTFLINGVETKVFDYKLDGTLVSFSIGVKTYTYTLVSRDSGVMIIDGEDRIRAAVGKPNGDGESIVMANGREALISAAGARKTKKASAHAGGLVSPMPGKIFKILKVAGSEVKKGDPILILEAMKMEHSIRSDKDGKVKEIFYKVGDLVQGGVALAEVSST